jgi:hypothetical protein
MNLPKQIHLFRTPKNILQKELEHSFSEIFYKLSTRKEQISAGKGI